MQMDLFNNWGWVIPQHVFISSFTMKKESVDTKIIQYFVMHGLGLCIKVDIYVAHMFYA